MTSMIKTIDKHDSETEIPKSLLEAARKERYEREQFFYMLETFMPETGYKRKGNERILDIGCGICVEADILSAYFGGNNFGNPSKEVQVLGIDKDEKQIERAISDYQRADLSIPRKTAWYLPEQYHFIAGDARNLDDLVQGKFDVVVTRHPNIAETSAVWASIYQKAGKRISDDGILIATSLTDIEHEMMREIIESSGFEIVIDSSNPHTIPLNKKEDIYIDKNVIFARKGTQK